MKPGETKYLHLILSMLLAAVFLLSPAATVSALTENVIPSAIGATDTTGDLLADLQADDASGNSPSVVTSGDGWYTVGKTYVMFIDNFDTSQLSGTVLAAILRFQYSVVSGYTGTNQVQWALDSGVLANTGIAPADGEVDKKDNHDLYAQGVDTLTKVSTLDVRFTNDDGGSPNAVSFDYVWVEVTVNEPPSIPTLSSPLDTSYIPDNTPTFEWAPSTDPEGDNVTYWIQIDNESDFSSPLENVDNLSDNFYTLTTELSDGAYYWRVQAVDNSYNNQSGWSSTWSFNVSIAAAFDFSLSVSPDNLTVQQTNSVSTIATLSLVSSPTQTVALSGTWVGTTPGGITPSFSPESAAPSFDSTLNFTTTVDATTGTYIYRIISVGGGKSRFANVTVNITEFATPAAPTLISPENGVAIETLTPTFDWSDSINAASYTFELATDNNFSNVVLSKTAVDSNVALSGTEKLSYGTVYYWRVRGTNAAGSGEFSSTGVLTAKLAAPKVNTFAIASGVAYTNSTTVQLTINAQNAVEMAFSIDGTVWSDWEPYQTSKTYTISGPDGTKSIYVRIRDNDEDISQAFVGSIILDQSPPSTTPEFSGTLGVEGYRNSVFISLAPTDLVSGAENTYYRINAGEWKLGSSFLITTPGKYVVEYYSVDKAGNSEEIKTFEVTVAAITSFPVEFVLAVLGAVAAFGIALSYFWVKIRPARILSQTRKELLEIKSLEKEAETKYYKEVSISRKTFENLMREYEKRKSELEKNERLLKKKVKRLRIRK